MITHRKKETEKGKINKNMYSIFGSSFVDKAVLHIVCRIMYVKMIVVLLTQCLFRTELYSYLFYAVYMLFSFTQHSTGILGTDVITCYIFVSSNCIKQSMMDVT